MGWVMAHGNNKRGTDLIGHLQEGRLDVGRWAGWAGYLYIWESLA